MSGKFFGVYINYQLRIKESPLGEKFAQLFYFFDNKECIAANFSDSEDAISIYEGNSYYRTHYRIVKYLEERGFDLASADKK